jgi:rare lipoprotein A
MRSAICGSLLVILLSPLLGGCAGSTRDPAEVGGVADVQTGLASYYGDEYHGRRTASGEVFDNTKLTAAHRTLPFSTVVRVTNLENGRSVLLRINDRGPFVAGRILDVSRKAAEELGFIQAGTVAVRLEILPGS